jgi:hypothetical protein
VNWRDPKTNLVHTVNYRTPDWANEWSDDPQPMPNKSVRFMVCGLTVGVTQEGLLAPEHQAQKYILLPWLHTQDEVSCLECLCWHPSHGHFTDEQ